MSAQPSPAHRDASAGRVDRWRELVLLAVEPGYCSSRAGRSGNGSEPHARDIALRRRAEQAAVLAAELRGAFIPHTPAGAARVEVLVQHQLPCFL